MGICKRSITPIRRVLASLFLLSAGGTGAAAQAKGEPSFQTMSVQPLSFGLLFPGQSEVVRVTDLSRRGVISLAGKGPVQLAMVLPQAMVSVESNSIPLAFGFGAGGLATSATAVPSLFDPAVPQKINLGGSGSEVWVYLGGTATVSPAQVPGSYSATVVVTVTRPNT